MGLKTTVATVTLGMGLLTAIVACSSPEGVVEKSCDEAPKSKACRKSAAPASTAGTMTETPVTTAPPVPGVPGADAGIDGARPRKPDGGTPAVPRADVACQDLLRCCARVQDTLERAACYAVGYKASASSCANAIIAYQIAGGCSHDPFELPDIFNSDGTYNESQDCTYLEQVCMETGDCDGAYQCYGTSLGGSGSGTGNDPYGSDPYGTDYCAGLDNTDDACGRNEYYCCSFGGDYYCGTDPAVDYSYCDGYYP